MDKQAKAETNAPPSFIKSVFIGLKAYLTDWRNLLGHALLGVLFVIVAIWAPINIWLKLGIIAGLIFLNILRMRNKAKTQNEKESADNELVS